MCSGKVTHSGGAMYSVELAASLAASSSISFTWITVESGEIDVSKERG